METKTNDNTMPCPSCQGGGCPVCAGYGYIFINNNGTK